MTRDDSRLWGQIMQMSALILRQHFCCASFYFLSWFLFLQILTGFLFKFLLSVVPNFLTLHGLPSSRCLPSLSFARSLRTFLSNQQMLPLSTDCSLPRLLLLLLSGISCVQLLFLSTSSPRSATNMKANLHNNFCQIFVSFGIFLSLLFFLAALQFLQKLKLKLFSFCLALALFGCGLLTLPSVWLLIKFNYFKRGHINYIRFVCHTQLRRRSRSMLCCG